MQKPILQKWKKLGLYEAEKATGALSCSVNVMLGADSMTSWEHHQIFHHTLNTKYEHLFWHKHIQFIVRLYYMETLGQIE